MPGITRQSDIREIMEKSMTTMNMVEQMLCFQTSTTVAFRGFHSYVSFICKLY